MKDLTNLKTYIIDSDDPHEVDDAISLEIKEGNKKNLWIHISNPCKLFLHDSNVDLDARKRNSSLYLIKNAKHGATIEQAETVNKKIYKFLF